MTVQQLSVFIENRVGRLAEITGILKDHNIDIRALSLADTTKFGILRLIVDQPTKAEEALKAAGMTVSLADVIAIGVTDRPGGLAEAAAALSEAGITVEYMYAFTSGSGEKANIILRVDDNDNALAVLEKAGITVLTPEQVLQVG